MVHRDLAFPMVPVSASVAVRTSLALILLAAAVLKAHQVATTPRAEHGLLDSRWFLIGVVEFELFFGLWLLGGFYPGATWRICVFCFAVFAAMNIYKGISGEAMCGCFGRVPLSPWYAMLVDVAALAGLLWWPPPTTLRGPPVVSRPRVCAALAMSWLTLAFASGVAMATYAPASLTADGAIVGDSGVVVLKPEAWTGQQFPLLNHIRIRAKLGRGFFSNL